MSEKEQFRREYQKIRQAVQGREQKNCQITQKVLQLECVMLASEVFCYVSFWSEVDTHALIAALCAAGKTVFVPLIRGGEMTLCRYGGEPLTPDRYGNLYADKPSALYYPPVTVVPMLAFTENRHRLGYGKGYYDRYLTGDTCSVGIAFEEQRSASLPVDAHDVSLTMIITDKKIYK